jgi:hypothetical protein
LDIPHVLASPPPNVVVQNYGDFAITYLIQIFAPDFNTGENIRDEMNLRLWYLAQRHSLTMPYPVQQEIPYLAAAATPLQQRQSCLSLLQQTPGFAALSKGRLEQMLARCEFRSYATHEVVLERHDALDGLYLIVAGEAELLIPDHMGNPCSLGVLLQGECFGEKSTLLHGRISDTIVQACDDLEVLLIPVEELQYLLLESPRLASDLTEVMEIRRRALQDAGYDSVDGLGIPLAGRS